MTDETTVDATVEEKTDPAEETSDDRPETVTFGETKSTVGITQAGDPPVVQTTPETTFVVGKDNLLTPKDQAEVMTADFEPEPQKEDPEAGLEGHSALALGEEAFLEPHHDKGAVGITDDIKILNARMGYPIDEPAMGPQPPDELEESEAKDAEDGAVDNDEAVPAEETPNKPTEENTVAEIKEYLDSQGTEYTTTLTKAELLDLV